MKDEYLVTQLDELLDSYQSIVVGHEGCVYRLLGNDVSNILERCTMGKWEVRLVTPFIPYNYLDKVVDMITKWSERIQKLKVTFNDYGLLYACKELIYSKKIIPVIGRILTRSMIDCPWHKELLIDEPNEICQITLGYNMNHNSKCEILKEYNIQEVEINYNSDYMEEFMKMNESLKVTCYSYDLISVGRLCFVARMKDMEYPKCLEERLCSQMHPIHLKAKGFNMSDGTFDEKSKQYFENMYLQGNVVYRLNKSKMKWIDNWIRG